MTAPGRGCSAPSVGRGSRKPRAGQSARNRRAELPAVRAERVKPAWPSPASRPPPERTLGCGPSPSRRRWPGLIAVETSPYSGCFASSLDRGQGEVKARYAGDRARGCGGPSLAWAGLRLLRRCALAVDGDSAIGVAVHPSRPRRPLIRHRARRPRRGHPQHAALRKRRAQGATW